VANDSFAATLACRRELHLAREKMTRNFSACVHIWRETASAVPFLSIFLHRLSLLISSLLGGKRIPCPPPPLSTEGASLSDCNTAGPGIRRCAARWPGAERRRFCLRRRLPPCPASCSSASLPHGHRVEAELSGSHHLVCRYMHLHISQLESFSR
jgi:hypothetical protein